MTTASASLFERARLRPPLQRYGEGWAAYVVFVGKGALVLEPFDHRPTDGRGDEQSAGPAVPLDEEPRARREERIERGRAASAREDERGSPMHGRPKRACHRSELHLFVLDRCPGARRKIEPIQGSETHCLGDRRQEARVQIVALGAQGPDAEAEREVLVVEAAIDLAQTALVISPEFGMSHTALAFAHLVRRDFDNAVSYSADAVLLQPNDPYVMTYHGIILAFNGQAQQGIAFAERALRLDPLNLRAPFYNILGTIYLHAGRFEEAVAAFQHNLSRSGPNTPASQMSMAAALYHLDHHEAAWKILNQIDNFPLAAANATSWTQRTRRYDRDIEIFTAPLREYANRQILN